MSAAAVIVLFGVACAKPCTATLPQTAERVRLEREVVRVLTDRGYTVKPAPEAARRPTGETASPEARDEVQAVEEDLARLAPEPARPPRPSRDPSTKSVDRVLVLDLEANERILWLTHFVRGVPGAWSIGQVVCAREGDKLECPELETVVSSGLRARRAEDVDLVAALRFQARFVGECIKDDDDSPIDERIFGRVELDLLAEPTGEVKVSAIAPALVARSPLGRCLRAAMEAMNVGPFDGEPIKLRIPIDLD